MENFSSLLLNQPPTDISERSLLLALWDVVQQSFRDRSPAPFPAPVLCTPGTVSRGRETTTAAGTRGADAPRVSNNKTAALPCSHHRSDTQRPVASSSAAARGTDDPGELAALTPRGLPQMAAASFTQTITQGFISSS